MPGPTSSNDLVLEMMREVIAERQRDLADGISPRKLARDLEKFEDRLRKLEEHAARSEAHVETTARYIIPPTPAVGFPPTTINVNGGPKSGRPSLSKSLKETANNPLVKWIAVGFAIALSHLLARCGIPPLKG